LIVVDASFAVDYLLHANEKAAIANVMKTQDRLCAPGLLDYEIGSVLRRYSIKGEITDGRVARAYADLQAMQIDIYDADQFRPRAWDLRNNMSFYDASYVALAEMLNVPLYTTDKRLASAPGSTARIICL
jgi:predicted nucleic acid-binding protein